MLSVVTRCSGPIQPLVCVVVVDVDIMPFKQNEFVSVIPSSSVMPSLSSAEGMAKNQRPAFESDTQSMWSAKTQIWSMKPIITELLWVAGTY